MTALGPWRGAVAGLAAGLVAGGVEAADRALSLSRFVEGPLEAAGLAFLIAAPVVLLATAVGAALGLAARLGAALLDRLRLAGWSRGAVAGAVLGVVGGLWLLFALTLTARLGTWLRLAPLLVGGVGLLGVVAGVCHVLWAHRAPRAARITALVVAALGLYWINARFAPQSSYGVHVLLDTAELGAAWLAALAALGREKGTRHGGPSPRAAFLLGALVLVLALGMDQGFRLSPRLEALVKIQGVVARRALDALSEISDWDRDGFAPEFLAGGFDTAPFDPRVPAPLLECAEGAPGTRGPGTSPAPAAADSARRPHLLLLTVDACRHDAIPGSAALELLGARAPALPHLDRLASRSAIFASCYAHSAGTEDSFTSFFAGRYHPALLCGVAWEDFLPARLEAAGYRVLAWANGFPMPTRDWGWERIQVREGATAEQVEEVAAFLAEPAASPGFAWLHLMDLHASILHPWSPQAYDQGAQLARYAAGLEAVDRAVGGLVEALEARGLLEHTLLVLTADHGEELGEHGHYHHNLTLYEPAVRVPLWVSGPGVEPGVRTEVVPQLDVHATFLAAAGLEPLAAGDTSLGDPSSRDGIYLFLPTRGFSRSASPVRLEHGQAAWVDARSGHKVILRFDKETEELYDLASDPEERRNLRSGEAPWAGEARAALWRELGRWRRPRSRRRVGTRRTRRHATLSGAGFGRS